MVPCTKCSGTNFSARAPGAQVVIYSRAAGARTVIYRPCTKYMGSKVLPVHFLSFCNLFCSWAALGLVSLRGNLFTQNKNLVPSSCRVGGPTRARLARHHRLVGVVEALAVAAHVVAHRAVPVVGAGGAG